MSDKDPLGTRIKLNYEDRSRFKLTRRMPVILRADGKAFHSLTRNMERPFDIKFMNCMWFAAMKLCEEVQGCKLAYVQSDEISLLLTDYENLDTEAWFDYNIQKMVSVAASIATSAFNIGLQMHKGFEGLVGNFDARAFNIPKEEVTNYYLWRQRDHERNSIQSVSQANFPHKQLQNLNCGQLQDKLMLEKAINWNDLPTFKKRGVCIIKTDGWGIDAEIPIFSQDRQYIERFV